MLKELSTLPTNRYSLENLQTNNFSQKCNVCKVMLKKIILEYLATIVKPIFMLNVANLKMSKILFTNTKVNGNVVSALTTTYWNKLNTFPLHTLIKTHY